MRDDTPPDLDRIDLDADVPITPRRRRLELALGCLLMVVIVGFLIWFVATHTRTAENRNLFGFSPVPAETAG